MSAWAYFHVPNGSVLDYTNAIENQISRFAPGFHDCILACSVSTPAAQEKWSPNLVGGDIVGSFHEPSTTYLPPNIRALSYFEAGLISLWGSYPAGRRCAWDGWLSCSPVALADVES